MNAFSLFHKSCLFATLCTQWPPGAGPERPQASPGYLETWGQRGKVAGQEGGGNEGWGNMKKQFCAGVLPECEGGRVPICDSAKPSSQHQTPGPNTLHAQVNIQPVHRSSVLLNMVHGLWYSLEVNGSHVGYGRAGQWIQIYWMYSNTEEWSASVWLPWL